MNDLDINKNKLILKEYGKNIQKLVEYVVTIEDREKRTKYAHTLIDLMKQIVPSQKDSPEYAQKLWDDLYIMSGFTLDVESPYAMPEKDLLGKKPKRVPYNVHDIKYKHYGRNISLLIEKAAKMEDPEEKEAAVAYIGKLMKSFYASWNKENVDDIVIIDNITELSKGELYIDPVKVKETGLFESSYRERERDREKDSRESKRPTKKTKIKRKR